MYYSIINLVKFLIVPTYKKHTKIIVRILQFKLDIDSMNLKKTIYNMRLNVIIVTLTI